MDKDKYIEKLTKCLTLGVSMETTLEGKASEKAAGKAILIKSIGASIMFICFGAAPVLFTLLYFLRG
ncbi:hypothetical protein GCM10007161_13490 [Ignatzschineria indica]|uniref:Uncharacterized protein n=1 Tax=Ignatzschineria indica TaxID=472583 RepID=A0A2U2AJP0_9GAMM|nr:hypothetical protein [Ignatzschineria indica]PWD83055.1 hypothetical protein DC082_06415 [Ignatzschineria indica]GGZ83298.1 hypothetical protein GCM10007161_13490 [Ignatzschineria indica]